MLGAAGAVVGAVLGMGAAAAGTGAGVAAAAARIGAAATLGAGAALIEEPTTASAACPTDDQDEQPPRRDLNKKVDDILQDAQPGRTTKGSSSLYVKQGGIEMAQSDFEALQPSNIYSPKEGITVGILSDGRRAILRTASTDGRPTLEIQSAINTSKIKIRYDSE